jgi:hypothetical protein
MRSCRAPGTTHACKNLFPEKCREAEFPDQSEFLNLVPAWNGQEFLGAWTSLKANCERRRQK